MIDAMILTEVIGSMLDNNNISEVEARLGEFMREKRPSIVVRDRYDVECNFEEGDFYLFEVVPGKDKRLIFGAEYCKERRGWKISMPDEPSMLGLDFRDNINDVLDLAGLTVRDYDLEWALLGGAERIFTYSDFKRRMKISDRDVEKLARSDAIDFCVQVPAEMDVYSFHVDSVPDIRLDRWSRANDRYEKKFTEIMKCGPTLKDYYRYLVVPGEYVVALLLEGAAKITRFQHAYFLGERLLASGNRYRVPPSTIPLVDRNGMFIRSGLFFGLNLKGTKYSFSEGIGYSPSPREVTFNRDDVFVRGLVLKDFVRSAEYEKIYRRNLRRGTLAIEGGRDNDFRDELRAAIDCLTDRGNGSISSLDVSLNDVLDVLRGQVGKKGGIIIRVENNGDVVFKTRAGKEKPIKIFDIERRFKRMRGAAKNYATPDFSELD